MSQKDLNLSEMNLPFVAVEPISQAQADDAKGETAAVPAGDACEGGDSSFDASKVIIFMESVRPTENESTNRLACFDMVLSVGILCDDGRFKTYSLVKRICLDKENIAKQAELGQPVSIVENKQDTRTAMNGPALKRIRRLAGLE